MNRQDRPDEIVSHAPLATPATDPSRAARPQVILTVNGPGEVSSWLLPLATMLKREHPDVLICVAMMPCVFSTGAELDVVRALPCIDAACSVRETLALMLRGRLPPGFRRDVPGFVMHLGGESYISWGVARRIGQPCFAYVEEPFGIQRYFDRVFFSGFHNVPENKRGPRGELIGEMMVDAARIRCPDREDRDRGKLVVGLYPGSRDYIVKFTLPFLAVVATKIAARRPDITFVLAKADFLKTDYLRALPDVHDGRPIEAETLVYSEDKARATLTTSQGLEIPVLSPAEAAARISLAVTIPGTNTAEMSALGIPMVVILPTWQAETAPLPGLAGHVGRLPIVGKWLKRLGALIYLRSLRYTAHPNRRTGRMVVPELVGHTMADDVADTILSLIEGDLKPVEAELRAIMGPPGATLRLVREVSPYLQAPLPVAASTP